MGLTRQVSTPTTAPTSADRLQDRLRQSLLDGVFAPGQQISSRRVAEDEGTSVIPARDALRGLVATGALAFRDSRTIIVPRLDAGALDEIHVARLALEGALAERAAPALFGKTAALAKLDERVNEAIQARDAPGYLRANRALHFAIYRAAQAPVLFGLTESLWLRFAPSMRLICEDFDGHLPERDHHARALQALKARNCADFRRSIEDDISQGIQSLLAQIEQPGALGAGKGGKS